MSNYLVTLILLSKIRNLRKIRWQIYLTMNYNFERNIFFLLIHSWTILDVSRPTISIMNVTCYIKAWHKYLNGEIYPDTSSKYICVLYKWLIASVPWILLLLLYAILEVFYMYLRIKRRKSPSSALIAFSCREYCLKINMFVFQFPIT